MLYVKIFLKKYIYLNTLNYTLQEGVLWDELREAVAVYSSQDRRELGRLLRQYKDVLVARAEMGKRNAALRSQIAEMRLLLKNVIQQ